MTDLEPHMRHALTLAGRGRGLVEPNPMVGAVVLDAAGAIAGEGWHERYGGPHAEVNAFAAAGEKARGGTLVLTLEPCCHHGKTPPCTDAVLRSGVRRVVAAMADPFPKVAGGGLKILRDAGLEVHVGLCEREAARLNAPYLKLLRTGRPWVHAKWAMTLDGKIATRTGDSRWISGEESRVRVHELRGRVDAVVVGRGTVEADDPMLTARPPGPRVATRVVVSASGKLPDVCRLRTTAREVPVIVYTAAGNEGELAGWARDGAEVAGIPINEKNPVADAPGSPKTDRSLFPGEPGASATGLYSELITALLTDLGRRRMTNVLVEGGGGLLGSLLDAGLADEFHVFIAPVLLGGTAAPPPVGGLGVAKLADALHLAEFTATPSAPDVYLHGVVPTSLPR